MRLLALLDLHLRDRDERLARCPVEDVPESVLVGGDECLRRLAHDVAVIEHRLL